MDRRKVKKSLTIAGRELTIETGAWATQASGSIVITYGDTVALATATSNKEAGEEGDSRPFGSEGKNATC